MKILVTGSSGFIGSYFIDNYKDRYKIETFSFLKNNLSTLDLSNIDTIIHLSALVHQKSKKFTYEDYEKSNVKQTIELAKKAKDSGVKHFIFMSTIKVYGEESIEPFREDSICNPKDKYGKSKLKAEMELQKIEDKNFKISIIRTPIVYGKGVKGNIQNLINLVQKVSILPLGKIKNRRSIIYIGNLCYFLEIIISKNTRGIFLVDDQKPISTTNLIELISKAQKRRVYLVHLPLFKELLKLIKPSLYIKLYANLEIDSRKTVQLLNAKPPYTTEESILRYLC